MRRLPARYRLEVFLTLAGVSSITLEGMPTYEYVCEKCGHKFDKVQSMSAAPLKICPKEACAKKPWAKGKVRRAISGGAGLIFKGSGFYITDYRSDKYKEAAKKDVAPAPAAAPAAASASTSASGGATKSGGETSSAAEPAAKPAPKPVSTGKG